MGKTLTIWLAEENFSKESIGLFSLLSLPISLKILWTPIIDHIKLPFSTDCERKYWLLFAIGAITLSLLAISFVSVHGQIWSFAIAICFLAIFTGCLYVAGIAYELESLDASRYGSGSAYVNTGYRLGLLCGGAGSLYLSALFDWSTTYKIMAFLLALGSLIIVFLPEPHLSKKILQEKKQKIANYSSVWMHFWSETIVQPIRSFFQKSEWKTILLIILTFKIGDELAKSMEGPFYLSLGYSKTDLATAAKLWGMAATISGALLIAPFLKNRNHFISTCFLALFHSSTLLCYYFLAIYGKSIPLLFTFVAIENFTLGMAMTAFIAFLWKVCDRQYAVVQYTLFWSVFFFKADLLGCVGGFLASQMNWETYFLAIFFISITISAFVLKYILPFCVPMPENFNK